MAAPPRRDAQGNVVYGPVGPTGLPPVSGGYDGKGGDITSAPGLAGGSGAAAVPSSGGGSGAGGGNGANMFGQGTFQPTAYPIDNSAITGDPTQGASQNYGLNDVWSNLQTALTQNQVRNYAGQAAQGQAAQAGFAQAGPTQISTAGDAGFQGQQAGLADTLLRQANGGGVSPADIQLAQGSQANLAGQLAVLGSQRGGGSGNAALAARQAADLGAQQQSGLNQQMGLQRAQETQMAQQAAGGVLGTARGQAQNYNLNAAQLSQQNQQFNAQNSQQSIIANLAAQQGMNLANLSAAQQQDLANQAAAIQAQSQFNNQQLGLLGAQTGIGETNRSAQLAAQQLGVQQTIANNQLAAQAYANNAQANANLTGTVANAGAGVVGTLVNALGKGGGGAPGGGGTVDTGSGATYQLNQGGGFDPNASSGSDENMKEGVQNGNPMLASFMKQYSDATAKGDASNKIDVQSGEAFHTSRSSRGPATAGDGGGGGIGSSLGGLAGGIAGGAALGSVVPGIGTVIGSALGGLLGSIGGGLAGNAVDPGTAGAGGGMTQTQAAGGFQPIGVTDADQTALTAQSDDNAKQNVLSGNQGVAQFLGQAEAQQGAQANQGANANPFQSQGQQPGWQLDRQMPPGAGAPPMNGAPWAPPGSAPPPGGYGSMFNAPGGTQGGPVNQQILQGYGAPQAGGNGPMFNGDPSAGGMTSLGGGQGGWEQAPQAFVPQGGPVDANGQPPPGSAQRASSSRAGFVGPGANANLTFTAPQAHGMPQKNRPPWMVSDEGEKKDIVDPKPEDTQGFLDALHAHQYRYKDPEAPGAGHGTFVSPMAQELEKTDLGKHFVFTQSDGSKGVDYGKGFGAMLAGQAMMNERLNAHDAVLAALKGRR